MDTQQRERGRPEGKEFTKARTLLLSPEEDQALRQMAQGWGCSAAAAMRRLIRERAHELRLMAPAPKALTPEEEDEQWRQAAERARHYYATDPEAREWAQFAGDTLDYPASPNESG